MVALKANELMWSLSSGQPDLNTFVIVLCPLNITVAPAILLIRTLALLMCSFVSTRQTTGQFVNAIGSGAYYTITQQHAQAIVCSTSCQSVVSTV